MCGIGEENYSIDVRRREGQREREREREETV